MRALLSLKHCRGALDTHSALLDTRAYALESRPTFSTAGMLNKARVKALLAPALYDPLCTECSRRYISKSLNKKRYMYISIGKLIHRES